VTFEFATATRIIFGAGRLREVGALSAELGSRALVVGGRTRERLAPLLADLEAHGLGAEVMSVPSEPTVQGVEAGVAQARIAGCDLVIAMGGGSVLDAGKAVAALLTNLGDVREYLEGVGRNRPLREAAAPCIAVPTTAGTGAEVTRNAVLAVPEARLKVSLRSPLLLPQVALIDPELTLELTPELTATTGFDALTQCLEPFVSPHANPLTDALCREGLTRVGRSLRRAARRGHDLAARTDMAVASLCGGLALANAKLGAVHGLAAPLGGMFPAPHGALCARLLPLVMAANLEALRAQPPTSPALARYGEAARLLTGDPKAQADAGVRWVAALGRELGIAPLSAFGVTERDLAEVVRSAQRSSSMQGNPVALSDETLVQVLRRAMAPDETAPSA
jgi:alcohol dehydrogenase class IV